MPEVALTDLAEQRLSRRVALPAMGLFRDQDHDAKRAVNLKEPVADYLHRPGTFPDSAATSEG